MSNFRQRTKINREIATISSVTPTDVVAAQSGYSIGITQAFVVNRANYPIEVTLYEESEKIIPSIPLGASGTMIWDSPGGAQLELITGSGIKATVSDAAASAEIEIMYVLHDERAPISKESARQVTFVASNVTTAVRTPNRFGGQAQS